MAPKIPTFTLNTGGKQPLFGLGTWLAKNPDELKVALETALDEGYRLIDTAHIYGNEAVIGEVIENYIKSGKLKREDLFIVTKLPFYAMDPKEADDLIPKQLAALRTNYVDLYLIHCPAPMKPKKEGVIDLDALEPYYVEHIDTWRTLEKWQKKGVFKAIGLSNFNAKQIQDLYDKAEIKPANLQVECQIYWPQDELVALCKKLNMSFTCYGPIGSPGRNQAGIKCVPGTSPMEDPLVQTLAKKYGKTSAQLIQRGLAVIPKSVSPSRVRENISIFDFELTAEEMDKFAKIQKREQLFDFKFCKESKFYPFADKV